MASPIDPPYLQCTRCILDTNDDPNMIFNDVGVCNYCLDYDAQEKEFVFKGAEGERKLTEIVDKIKKVGKHKEYDSIIGLSGGVDSTYLSYLAKKLGLRPLAVHFDNGWNSELAVKNIENIVARLGFDLYTYVVNWEEFKDLQMAYLKASVIDIEAITDHAIIGTLYRLAKKYRIKYILSGSNVVTEAILPIHWVFNKADHINIKAIHKHFGSIPLKTFPFFNTFLKQYVSLFKIHTAHLLNYVTYIKKEVKKLIGVELNWRDYGCKHGESVFTRFYQCYILPTKFKVDKRKAHLSNLVCSRQMTREEALEEIKRPIYDAELLRVDMEFVLNKFALPRQQFDEIMKLPVRSHHDFDVEIPLWQRYPFLKPLRFVSRYYKA